jgi:hypothetical protein
MPPAACPRRCLLTLCGAGDIAAANRLATDGVFDHYLPHPDEFDPGRLAVSARLGLRLSGSTAAARAPAAPAPATFAPPAGPVVPGRDRPIILMVEDDEFTHQLVAVTLASHGCRARVRERREGARSSASVRCDPTWS